jgi:hypothetical protein
LILLRARLNSTSTSFFFLESIDEDDELMMMTCLLVMQRDGRTVGERERGEVASQKQTDMTTHQIIEKLLWDAANCSTLLIERKQSIMGD